MNILFLDDDKYRKDKFKSLYPHADTVDNAAGCIAYLKNKKYDIVLLDHDLGNQIMQSEEEENSGSEVVRWIIAHTPKIGRIIIHSFNYPAATSMKSKLEPMYSVSIVPYSVMITLDITREIV